MREFVEGTAAVKAEKSCNKLPQGLLLKTILAIAALLLAGMCLFSQSNSSPGSGTGYGMGKLEGALGYLDSSMLPPGATISVIV